MKQLFAFLLLTAAASFAYPQKVIEYRVVRVVGTVEDEVTKKILKTDDRVPSNHKLKFATHDARIVVMSPETGRKTISGVPSTKSFEFLELLQSFVIPDQKPTGTRGGAFEYFEHLKASFAFDKILILSPGYFPINTDKVSLTAPAVIQVWYQHNRKTTYRKVSDASGFKLDQMSVFGDHALTPLPKILVEYHEDGAQDPVFAPGVLIAAFVPLYTDENKINEEVRVLTGSLSAAASDKERFDEIRNYLAAEYAMPQEYNLRQWLIGKGFVKQ